MDVCNSMGVGGVVPTPPGGVKVIGTRWVDTNEQDDSNPKYRSRFVAKEAKLTSGSDA